MSTPPRASPPNGERPWAELFESAALDPDLPVDAQEKGSQRRFLDDDLVAGAGLHQAHRSIDRFPHRAVGEREAVAAALRVLD